MSSKRKVNRGSSSEEDESGRPNVLRKSARKKSAKIEQTFRIYYPDLLTTANRGERKKITETLELEVDTSEREIRETLISNLPQLRDKRFKFFTKDKDGNRYWCPCSLKCESKDHSPFEWNGRNIRQSARSNRAVYILIDRERVNESTSASTSGYETSLPESDFLSSPMFDDNSLLNLSLDDEELQPYLDIDSPPNPTLLTDVLTSEVSTEPPRSPIVIKEIVPEEGNIEGGYTFYLGLEECCRINILEVQFDHSVPIYVEKMGEKTYRGKVPPSSTPGVVQVKIVNISGDIISNRVPFTYTDENATKKHDVREEMKNMNEAELQELLIATAKRFGEMNLKSKEETSRYDNPGGGKTQALPLLRMIADTAARINAMDFFKILFSTHVGCTVFKSFKDEQPPLEEIARMNGHEELACLLEKKHLMYRDDENESDDEVDWRAITKAVEEYQAINDESVEKWSIQSTDSSERLHGYLGDGENSTSLTSLHVSVSESCYEDKFEEQQVATELQGREESDICHAKDEMSDGKKEDRENYTSYSSLHVSVGEGCYEDTFKEQQAATELRDPEKPDNCHEKTPSSFTVASSSAKIEMNEVHKLNGTNSSKERLNKEGYLNTKKPSKENPDEAERKLNSQMSEGTNAGKFPDVPNFYSLQPHLKEVCSLRNVTCVRHLPLEPVIECEDSKSVHRKEHASVMKTSEESDTCVRVNKPSNEPDPIDHSNPLTGWPPVGNQNKRKLSCAWRTGAICFMLLVAIFVCAIVVILTKDLGTGDKTTPAPIAKVRTTGYAEQQDNNKLTTTYVEQQDIQPKNPCRKNQHWVENTDGPPLCIDCPHCPPGRGLLPECGNSNPLPPSTMVKCVSCIRGISFSSDHDTSVCTPCSFCAKNQVVVQNCSLQADTKCAKQCYSKERYYDDSKGVCFGCSKCCGDDQDVVEDECKGKLGTGSSMICSFHSSVNRCDKSTTAAHKSTTVPSQSPAPTPTPTNTSASEGFKYGDTTSSSLPGHFPSQRKDHSDLHVHIAVIVVVLALLAFGGIYLTCFCKSRPKQSSLWYSSDADEADVGIPLVSMNTKSQSLVVFCEKPTDGNLDGAQANLVRPHALCKPGAVSNRPCKPLLKEGDKQVARDCTCSCQNAKQTQSDFKLLKSLLDSNDLEEICDGLDGQKWVIEWLLKRQLESFATVVRNVTLAKRSDGAQMLEAYNVKRNKESTDI